MLTHAQIWSALDRLAARSGLSASALAKRAGLDPTTFNRSKRITPDDRPRWPSTESVAKALTATGTTIDSFVGLITDNHGSATQAVPLIGLAEAGAGGFFDDGGFPVGKGWDEIAFPAVNDEHAFALEISGDSMMPAYRVDQRRQDEEGRGDGEGVETADVKKHRIAIDQCRASRPNPRRCRRDVDRPGRLGESVALCPGYLNPASVSFSAAAFCSWPAGPVSPELFLSWLRRLCRWNMRSCC